MTDEQVAEMRATRVNGQIMSHAAAYPALGEDPLIQMTPKDELEIRPNQIGFYIKALVASARQTIVDEVKKRIPESKKLAKEKKRPRVFDLPLDLEGVTETKEQE